MKDSNTLPSRLNLALWGVFFLSGTAALGFQVVWSKMLALSLGHEFRSVVAVVVAFFGGMALGGALWSRFKFSVPKLELAIGVWGALSAPLLQFANDRFLFSLGPVQSAVCVFALLLPATTAMGATLPAMTALASGATRSAYAGNTFGGVLGCFLAAFLLMPNFPLPICLLTLAVFNFAAAALAFSIRRNQRQEILTEKNQNLLPSIPTLLGFFATGFVALGFETLGVRLLSQSLENTVYTFATVLAVFLGGNAVGAALFRRWRQSAPKLIVALVVSIGISLLVFWKSPEFYDALRRSFGDSIFDVAGAEFLVTLSAYALPTVVMGALFVELAEQVGLASLGKALFWNSIGAGLGAALVPFGLLPMVGGFLARPPQGHRIVAQESGAMAAVMVTESPDRQRTLFVNNRFQMGGTAAAIPELRQGHIPLLLAAKRDRALFLGLGTGITFGAARVHPHLQADAVELLPEVANLMGHFFPKPSEFPLVSSHLHLHIADARRFIRQTTNSYDVIVGELFHPAQDGAGFLYTAEHFWRVKQRLAEYGLFCQWLPLHQLDLETFQIISKTFLSVFPEAEVYLLRFNIDAPVVGLIGWNRPQNPKLDVLESVLNDPRLAPEVRRVALNDSVRLMGCLLADNDQLRSFAGNARINSDQHPIVVFEAPRFSYLHAAPTYGRLVAFMDAIGQRSVEKFPSQRHYDFARARDVYLRALVKEAQGEVELAIDGYIESARLSDDFTSGYAQCIVIATARSKTDPEKARRILERLVEAQPNRPVAREMLDRLR